MKVRGLRLNRKTFSYIFGAEFRRACDGCGRRWHFKGALSTWSGPHGRGPTRFYCDGDCEGTRWTP